METKLLLRRALNQKGFTLLNLLALTLGIGTSILIFAFVYSELTHDQFHTNSERIYRINQTFIWGDDNKNQFSSTGPGVAVALKEEVPEFEKITRVHTPGQYLISNPSDPSSFQYDNDEVLAVEENFLEVFSFPLHRGDQGTCLDEPFSIVLSPASASKYFGTEDPIGKALVFQKDGEEQSMVVTGVLESVPENSYIQFDFITTLTSIPRFKTHEWSWIWTTYETFGLLAPGASIETVKEKLSTIPAVHAEPTLKRIMGLTFKEYEASGKEWKLYAQAFSNIHLGSENVYNRLNSTGNKQVVTTLIGAAIFVLLLSCLNYVNLKTSQVNSRAKTSGLLRLLGAARWRIASSYLLESLAFCLLAVSLGVLLLLEALGPINTFFGETLSLDFLGIPQNLLIVISGIIILTLISGVYPAFVLSAFKPIDVLKGTHISPRGNLWVRNGFIIFQFMITMTLISTTILVFKQLDYTLGKDLGFSRENLISINKLEWSKSREALLNDIKNNPQVQSASLCSGVPPEVRGGDQFIKKDDQRLTVPLNFLKVDDMYQKTLGLEIIQGRNFSGRGPSELDKVVLNEAAVKALEWDSPQEAVGKKLIYPGEQEFEIVGVVKDFSFWGANAPVEPMAMFHIESGMYDGDIYFIAIKTKKIGTDEEQDLLANLKMTWQSHSPRIPFDYSVVEENIRGSFQEDEMFGKALYFFSSLAMSIASLGLLAILIFSLEQRTKEIAIRKIMGGSLSNISKLLFKEFFWVVIPAILLGAPISYWIIQPWLMEFQDPVFISVIDFMKAGVIIIAISILLSLVYLLRAQKISPIVLLKEE